MNEGFNASLTHTIDSIVCNSIVRRAMPAAQVVVARNGTVVHDKAYGHMGYGTGDAAVSEETLFDLASVSKTVGTLPLLMKAYDDGLWQLGDTLARFFPELDSLALGRVTMSQLLTHTSGLPPSINIFKLMTDTVYCQQDVAMLCDSLESEYEPPVIGRVELRSDVFSVVRSDGFPLPVAQGVYASVEAPRLVLERILSITPGMPMYRYSDVNFCLLMEVLKVLRPDNEPDELAFESVYAPLGAWHMGYLPSTYYDIDSIAPTEMDNRFRNQLVRGYVHDETAAFSGGVQGNSGVFGNALDLAKLCQTWLQGGIYGDAELWSSETNRLFTQTKASNANRGLGFDRLSNNSFLNSHRAGGATYGHTGFTGTCYWVDPDNDVIVIVLTNRVYPTRNNPTFNSLNPRGAVIRAVYNSLL